ncbi:LysR family transcriptional regulator [Rivibacter subsaxonicus]|uniref:LysR family transcriptional regulator n=1 Tax=Rivibacter subsaxonicus TaxID=457575 RepID=A0A4Q7VV17_9BURK|nr:LysR family transcriptional regulator [Rivibacter subsaxonicus]RZU00502.1 LysR family transcriptional regulator [Rivibacter subsaxonicus]
MELGDLDLNQLVLFQHLMVERRVSKVADVMGLTQPAVSNSLARLRKLFGDELFIRTPSGMVPTPFAEQLSEPVGYALAMIHSGLNQHAKFDPARIARSMTIGMTDIGEIVFLPRLVERLSREAPGITLSTVRNAAVNLRDDMEAGRVDIAIGLLPQLKAGFFQRRLFRQRYVCLFRQGHRLDRKKLTLADYRAAEHLVVVSAGTGHGKVDELMRRSGIERLVRLTVPHFVGVGHILQATELVATVPERLAQRLAEPFGLSYLPHPAKLPDIAINVFWHAKAHRSPANQWLRGVVCELFADDQVVDPAEAAA